MPKTAPPARLMRVGLGCYECGTWAILRTHRPRWELWGGDRPLHAYPTLAEARAPLDAAMSAGPKNDAATA